MSVLKTRIQGCFDKAGPTYGSVAHVQRDVAHQLTSLLIQTCPDFRPRHILDVGTGTGEMVTQLLPHYPRATYVLNDLSPVMLTTARKRYGHLPQVHFHQGDMETTDFAPHDLGVSTMALQWADTLHFTLERLLSRCQVVAISLPVTGTFDHWRDLLRTYGLGDFFRPPPCDRALMSWAQAHPAILTCTHTQDYPLVFPSTQGFMAYVKGLGASVGQLASCAPISHLRRLMRDPHTQPFTTSYTIRFMILESRQCAYL